MYRFEIAFFFEFLAELRDCGKKKEGEGVNIIKALLWFWIISVFLHWIFWEFVIFFLVIIFNISFYPWERKFLVRQPPGCSAVPKYSWRMPTIDKTFLCLIREVQNTGTGTASANHPVHVTQRHYTYVHAYGVFPTSNRERISSEAHVSERNSLFLFFELSVAGFSTFWVIPVIFPGPA